MQSKQFASWKMGGRQFLFVHGIPGCGKTVLCSAVIEHVQGLCRGAGAMRDYAYFYFDAADAGTRTVAGLLRSMIVQLCGRRDRLPGEMQRLRSGDGSQEPRSEDLVPVFLSLLDGVERTYLIIDAPEECIERDALLDLLAQISARCGHHVALLATGRNEPDIAIRLAEIGSSFIVMEDDEVDTEIKWYVWRCLSRDPELKRWPDSIKDEIENTLIGKAHGM